MIDSGAVSGLCPGSAGVVATDAVVAVETVTGVLSGAAPPEPGAGAARLQPAQSMSASRAGGRWSVPRAQRITVVHIPCGQLIRLAEVDRRC
jgi:hypothetical protein